MSVLDLQTELRAEEGRQLLDFVLDVIDAAQLVEGVDDLYQFDKAARPTERACRG